MLFGLLAAAVAATQNPAPSMADDPDLHCMVALSIALGGADDGIIDMEDEERTGIVSLVMYYVGKIDGRLPGFDYASEVTKLVQSPSYTEATLVEDLDRCGEEAERRGQTLIELGEQLKNLEPLMRGDRRG